MYLRDSKGREWMWIVEGTDEVVRAANLTERHPLTTLPERVVVTEFKVITDA